MFKRSLLLIGATAALGSPTILFADLVPPKIRRIPMNDPVAKRLRDLLQITTKLRENIEELLGGLSKQLEALEEGIVRRRSGNRRRQFPKA
jgi:hypothetical protein